MEKPNLVLYTREKCPLCDTAKRILEDFSKETGMRYQEIDIYSDDQLTEEYGLMIPVLTWKSEVIQYGRIEKAALYSFVEN
ncbi:glutaredoxin family protein [Peribacillus psychrosaccharolyticus]|uniref:glutaredoxin family protein n=1 Tax=Peribacillus psychrosaccharolyticus TaxID=1407 RepID=UPI003D2E66A1